MVMSERPKTRYAKSGEVSIAYQVVGDGPRDLVFVPGWVSNIEVFWDEPSVVRFFERLASFARLILFDKRGTGLSDRVSDMPPLEVRMDDMRAVMDAAGSGQAAVFGYSEGGQMCALFAATYRERTSALIMHGSYARLMAAPDYPWGRPPELMEERIEECLREWGGPMGIDFRAPTMASDPRFCDWWARFLRHGASPAAAAGLLRMNCDIDIRGVLPSIRVPTLILHPQGDQTIDVRAGRLVADRIPGARFLELPGKDHLPFCDDADTILDEIEEFLTGVRRGPEPDRVLATVMFTDVVDATRKASELGDHRWRDLLVAFQGLVREQVMRFRGREIDSAGDGLLATFDGPARAVRAAAAVNAEVRRIGLEVRTGLHTGECEVIGAKLGGIAVHIGARIGAMAKGGEVLVSSTVRDLVAGSGLRFADHGTHTLKGVPGDWHIFAVETN
jgi:pimeloyl-ACP methyl ester carboxylesterase